MIDLTPLDVRKKAGDFKKVMRGYDPEEVEGFLQLTAERLEELVKENLTLRERTDRLSQQVTAFEGREGAVREALVVAQQLREELKVQAQREAELLRQEVEAENNRRVAETDQLLNRKANDAEQHLADVERAVSDLERRRLLFLRSFKALLQRELESVEVEEGRIPDQESAMDLDLGRRRRRTSRPEPAGANNTSEGPPASGGSTDGRLWLSPLLKEGTGEGEEGQP
jgi:cell division initiation protein